MFVINIYRIFESEKITPLSSQSQSVEVTTVMCHFSVYKQEYA